MSIEFHVPDMTCGHCVKTLTDAVLAVAPGASVAADLVQHRLSVNGADQADEIEAAIRDAGYAPQRR